MTTSKEPFRRGILPSMSNEISREASWAFASDKLGRWLLHLPSGVVGKVGKVYAPGEYKIPADGDSVEIPARIEVSVLGFEGGNAFLAYPGNFLILSEGDHQVFLAMSKGIGDLCFGVLKSAGDLASLGSTPESTAAVIRAALQAQLKALAPR